ncbi:MAG: S1 RNA-binding domain-containing protein, partial [Methylococcaceae bacterium]|nr:S1 RNA-binding domain-containing protein [Methylococcaceae bacterium]
QLKGERTNTNFRLGDTVKVKVARVDLDEKKIDFDLIQKQAEVKKGSGAAKTGTAKKRRRKK